MTTGDPTEAGTGAVLGSPDPTGPTDRPPTTTSWRPPAYPAVEDAAAGTALPPLLQVTDLRVTYRTGDATVAAVRGVDLTVGSGEALGIAGESGSGKTTLVMSFLRLLPSSATVTGKVLYHGEDVLTMSWGRVRAVRWAGESLVFQGAMSALNPVRTIENQISEPILLHEKVSPKQARARSAQLLGDVGLPMTRLDAYPHELSGGQRQRAIIAMALACEPDLIIADEPTTALDVMVQAQILQLLKDLSATRSMGLVMISHDLSVLAEACDRLAVMYAGEICEIGPTDQVRDEPRHPYSAALLDAFPVIGDPASRRQPHGLPGDPPDIGEAHTGCPFAPRCPVSMPACTEHQVRLWDSGAGRQSSCLRVLPEYSDGADLRGDRRNRRAPITERTAGA